MVSVTIRYREYGVAEVLASKDDQIPDQFSSVPTYLRHYYSQNVLSSKQLRRCPFRSPHGMRQTSSSSRRFVLGLLGRSVLPRPRRHGDGSQATPRR